MHNKPSSHLGEKKFFSRYKKPFIDLPNLVEVQTFSYEWFLKEGIKELFDEFSPISDYSEKEFTIEFIGFSVSEPKFNEYESKLKNLTYSAPLKVNIRLTNKFLKETRDQEIFFADLPLMTDHGTFIINGVERVIVPQLARSFGAYFTSNIFRGHKYFGAKIIPNRGAWIEIETDPDGAIYARIDRKRKIPITSFLRVLRAVENKKTNQEIGSYFDKIDTGKIAYIKNTLEKDVTTKTDEDAFMEVFKRLRPEEPTTPENARGFIEDIFSPARYDLSQVGRYKLNYRLGFPVNNIKNESKVISFDDMVAIISKIIEMNNDPRAVSDDIDHLGNRRIRAVGEMLQQRLRVGMARLKKNIQDRMSTLDKEVLMSNQIVNPRPFSAVMKEFFATNQLSQFMGQQNMLSEVEHLRRLSALGPGGLTRERAGLDVRDVHTSHYGRICPIQTPEGPNIGLVVNLSSYAKLNEYGIIETPYRKVVKGKITTEIVYLNAHDESKYNIANAMLSYDSKTMQILDDQVEARSRTNPGYIPKEEVDFVDVAPNQAFSIATSLVPFLEHDDATRALMGSNMMRQATPCIVTQAPLVATGIEEKVARDSGRLIIAKEDGEVSFVDASEIRIKEKKSKKERIYKLTNFLRTNDFTAFHHKPIVNMGDKISAGQVLADNSSSRDGQLALGQNILVAFLSWGGANYEDAIVISEKLVKDHVLSSIHLEEFSVNVRDTKLGPEQTTFDIPNVGEDKLKDLDEDGIVRIGAEVRAGDILVGKITPKGETELTPEERLLRSIFGEKARDVKDTSLRLEHGKRGRVVSVRIFSREKGDKLESGIIKQIKIEVAQIRKILVGDKLSGRHGNKGVISKVLPEEEMPYLADGTPVDIILSPLGIASRMNFGQILETHLGWAAAGGNFQAITTPFDGVKEEEIKEELKKAGLPETGKTKLFDGRTGEAFANDVTVGYMYIMKLHHMVEDKIHMRSVGPYSLITQQPLGGKAQGGGQRFGEMEVWALEGYGAAHILQEMLTIKSDDIIGRSAAYDAIVKGESFKEPNLPASFHVLLNELKGLALDVELKGKINENK
ncbi:MAG: DNA-directed RNA polymerase subunit beta [Parcubacteria group bacterium]|nr:DNA-directed RNA polymerase subunit beta [Parcubacteria group bacterium]MCR4342411.1 DNA-directed RNA polymerase subunit beta [Patescibacteria group bacterium]